MLILDRLRIEEKWKEKTSCGRLFLEIRSNIDSLAFPWSVLDPLKRLDGLRNDLRPVAAKKIFKDFICPIVISSSSSISNEFFWTCDWILAENLRVLENFSG